MIKIWVHKILTLDEVKNLEDFDLDKLLQFIFVLLG